MAEQVRVCTRCVMDSTEAEIQFDEQGVCNHCKDYERMAVQRVIPPEKREGELRRLVEEIKLKGKGKDYDVIIGVSGGVDSTYVAWLMQSLGLRPLAVHLDNGWDSELAVGNIEKFLNKLGIDLYTKVLDWEEFRDLQIAFLRASVPDAEIPTDHAIWATLYRAAVRNNVGYIMSGLNFVTEALMPRSWAYGHYDWRYIKSVYRRYGTRKTLKDFPHFSFLDTVYYFGIKKIKVINILDYINYDKLATMKFLERELGWRPYAGKHYESIYTRFFQGYILPVKFGIDKRKAHLSTLVMSGQISRSEALEELKKPPLAGTVLEEDMEYVIKKFEMTPEEFTEIMALPGRTYHQFQTYLPLINTIRRFKLVEIGKKVGLLSKKIR